MAPFEGIKYSSTTDIFYRWYKGKLQRFSVYKNTTNSSNLYKWVDSDYKDMHGQSSKWTEVTKEQIAKYHF